MKRKARIKSIGLIALALALTVSCAKPPETANRNGSAAVNANLSEQQPSPQPPPPELAGVRREPPKRLEDNQNDSGPGSIEVTSTPPGAAVLLISLEEEGAGAPQPRGSSPTTITGVASGKYSVHLEKQGFKSYQKNIMVAANKTVKVVANLQKQ